MRKEFLILWVWLIFLIMFAVPVASAQTEEPDSLTDMTLQEVVIKAPRVIRKADMDLYYPSKSATDNSANGMQLLGNLMIPSLTVDDALGSIKASGQSVQVRINGREATIDQVRALLPETIKRVEWIDNPGLRYGGANYVVNFIVSNPTLGGSLMASGHPALNTAWGRYVADVKFNSGRSQWEAGAHYKMTNRLKSHRDYEETFTYPDGTSLTREESSRGGVMDNSMISAWASYNYLKPDTTVLVVDFGLFHKLNDRFLYNGELSLSDGSDDILLTDSHGDKGTTPSLSVYLEQHFSRRQALIMNFSSSFYFGNTYSDYLEQLPGAGAYINDIHTDIHDRNQAYAIEADYIKNWQNGRLTAGATYTANRNRSAYASLDGAVFHQRQNKVYIFAEYFHRFGKWTATAGMGVQYNDFVFAESGRGTHTWSPRPQATITYSPDQNHNIRLNFTSWQSTPTLAETNVIPQQLDGFQWRLCNQNLKTANSYMMTLRYGFNLPRVSGTFGVRAFSSPNAITPLLRWEGDRLLTTYENSHGLRNLSFFLAPQIEIVPEWFTVSGYLQYRLERMSGTDYLFHHNAWSGSLAAQVTHWGFVLSGRYMSADHDLWGEKISWGESVNMIDLSYNWRSWQFMAGILMPFGKYDQGSRSLSKWNRNEQHMRLDMRMPYIQISYNFQWGRQRRGAEKLVNTDASADRSTAGGR